MQRNKEIKYCVQFNNNFKEGLKLINQAFDSDPKKIADFFHRHQHNLDLEKVGDFLSRPDPENIAILDAFVKQMNFHKQDFLDAIRAFLKSLLLPGEAQKIDRLVGKFSEVYFAQNRNDNKYFENEDAVYLLAFQTIMLHTDLHKSNLLEKQKMTFAGLKKNLKGVNNHGDFDEGFLLKLYTNIKQFPLEYNFVETNPGFEFASKSLDRENYFKKLDKFIHSTRFNANIIFPTLDENIVATVTQPKSWLNSLFGYQGSITLSKDNNNLISIQVYTPNLISKWFYSKHPKLIIQPIIKTEADENAESTITIAAKIAASFNLVPSIKGTYEYLKEDLSNAYNSVKSIRNPHENRMFFSSSTPREEDKDELAQKKLK